jgi:hypothetical protein
MRIVQLLGLFILLGVTISCSAQPGSSAIIKAINKGKVVVYKDKEFTSSINLIEGLEFKTISAGHKMAEVRSPMVFVNCMFTDFIAFERKNNTLYSLLFTEDVMFLNCTFNGKVDFTYAEFERNFSCNKSAFAAQVSLKQCWFKGRKATFEDCTFHQSAYFTNVIADNQFSLFRSRFNNQLIAQGSYFKGSFQMNGATLNAYCGFDQVRFGNGLLLDQSKFNNKLNLDRCCVTNRASFSGVQFQDVSLESAQFTGVVSDKGAEVRGSVQVGNAQFINGILPSVFQ